MRFTKKSDDRWSFLYISYMQPVSSHLRPSLEEYGDQQYYFDPSSDAKYSDQRVCVHVCLFVCLFVCVSVCTLACLENHTSKFQEIFCTCYLWPWLGPPVTIMRWYVLPVLWTTSMERIGQRVRKRVGENRSTFDELRASVYSGIFLAHCSFSAILIMRHLCNLDNFVIRI